MGKEMVLDRITAKDVGFDLTQEAKNVSKVLQQVPDSRKEILETAARQIRTYESETLEDNIVSFYPCFIHEFKGKTKLFSADVPRQEFLIENSIDPLERDGEALEGFREFQRGFENTRLEPKFFLWVSPRGSAGTQGIYKDINYRYHQIYIGETDGRKTKAYALKSDIEESALADWINNLSQGSVSVKGNTTEEFLLNPLILPSFSRTHNLETALFSLKEILGKRGQKKFYRGIDIDDIPKLVRERSLKQRKETQAIAEELEKKLSSDIYLGYEEARKAIGGQLYVLYKRYANEKGEVELTGCAGGSISINKLFDNSLEITSTNIFSTEFRLQPNDTKDTLKCVTCPFCGKTVDAKVTSEEIICPECKKTAKRKP